MKISPCLSCTRVADPRECENKDCRVWRAWFTEKWDAMRMDARLAMEKVDMEQEGVCIGGVRYAMPHRVRSYLHSDPCSACLCPRDLCRLPCKVKRVWEQARQDVFV